MEQVVWLVGCSCFRSCMTSWWSRWLTHEIATRRWNKLKSSRSVDCINTITLLLFPPAQVLMHGFGTVRNTIRRMFYHDVTRTTGVPTYLIWCLHDRANIEQLAGRSMAISMLIRRAGGL